MRPLVSFTIQQQITQIVGQVDYEMIQLKSSAKASDKSYHFSHGLTKLQSTVCRKTQDFELTLKFGYEE